VTVGWPWAVEGVSVDPETVEMRAVVRRRYGPPEIIRVEDVPKPEVAAGHIVVRVRAASVNRSDWEVLIGSPPYARGEGLRRPRTQILGTDFAGTVEAVGEGVSGFAVGDRVFGDAMYHGGSTFAEHVSIPEKAAVVPMPDGLDFESAATLPQAGSLAIQGMQRVRAVAAGDRVAIVGAGGGGGTFAIQLARNAGARVTAVDLAGKLDSMKDLGADRVVDAEFENHLKLGPYDRILDFVGRRSVHGNRRALAPGGVYSVVGGPVRRLAAATLIGRPVSKLSSKDIGVLMARQRRTDLVDLAEMVVQGDLTPVVYRIYSLDEAADALADLGANEVFGKAVITI
jgi:NADPH:quinone reductase-like Zn-dependent oxidoreductase